MMRILLTLAQTSITGGSGGEIDIPTSTPVEPGSLSENLLPIVFALIGAISLLYVVIGGFRYVISAGEPGNTQKARETILYALIGLVVSISAFTIVNFVLGNVTPDETGTNGIVGPDGILTQVVQLLAYATGIAAVIMIIYGALRYVLSGGDSSATKSARDTILYAVVGLIVAISAQAIVTFVLGAL
jgi:hypothetical protein